MDPAQDAYPQLAAAGTMSAGRQGCDLAEKVTPSTTTRKEKLTMVSDPFPVSCWETELWKN